MSAALYLGDCRELLRWLPDCSVDAIVTDPPYELSDDGKHSPERVALEVMFPEDAGAVPRESDGCELHRLTLQVAGLCGVRGVPRPAPSVPVGSVAFDRETAAHDVNHPDPSATIAAESDSGADMEPEETHHAGCFLLELGDRETGIDALHATGTAHFAGGIGVGLGIPPSCLPSLLGRCAPVIDRARLVGLVDHALAAEVGSSAGAEAEAVPWLSAGCDPHDCFSAVSAFKLLALAHLAGARLVRTCPGTCGLSAKLQARRIRVVSRATGRALTFDLVTHGANVASKGFMGHAWDGSKIAFDVSLWREALRVLKPGGHVIAYGAARTYHWLACAVELAGFEIRDMVPWLQGQGRPHGIDVSKAIDKAAGAERPVVGKHPRPASNGKAGTLALGGAWQDAPDITAPATPEAAQWSGWNTQLAPGHEPAVLARKPLSEPTVAANVLRWGTGALNVDACRLGDSGGGTRCSWWPERCQGHGTGIERAQSGATNHGSPPAGWPNVSTGRWPPNVTLSEAAAGRLDATVGGLQARGNKAPETGSASGRVALGEFGVVTCKNPERGRPSGPSEFFYTAKAATREREQGCEHLRWARSDEGFEPWEPGMELPVDHRGQPIGNPHPTVKPLALMRWLVRLVTPPGGFVLDPFMGSGTTGVACEREGFRFIGSDMTPWAHAIARSRIRWAQGLGAPIEETTVAAGPVQGALFA